MGESGTTASKGRALVIRFEPPNPLDDFPLDACPDCGGRDFAVETRDGEAVFRCGGCASAWRYALGFIWRVDAADPGGDPILP